MSSPPEGAAVSDHRSPWALDRSYWLCRCAGFAVDDGDRRIGHVRDVLFESRLDRPDLLVVRSGGLHRSELRVPVEDVETILPGERRVVLARATAAPPSLADDLRQRLHMERRGRPAGLGRSRGES
jgi:hypothetical protein